MVGRNRMARSASLPVFLSLVVHGLFFVILGLVPTRAETSARVAIETCVIALDTQSEIRSAQLVASSTYGSVEETEFNPVIVGALPAATVPAPDKLPAVSPPSATSQPRGPANGGSQPTAGRTGPPGTGPGSATNVERPAMFGPVAPDQRVVYLLDRSISMSRHQALDHARQELVASLARLPAAARFQVIAYNRIAEPIYLDNGAGWLEPDATTRERVRVFLEALAPSGGTVHERALERALSLQPDIIYLVTDGDELPREKILYVTRLNHGRAVIHTIELSGRGGVRADHPLRQLAAANGGTYRQVVLTE
jgi:hypothetical protein